MTEEVWFFGRSAAYGLVVGIVYWFVSYDISGTFLLLGFGAATGFGFAALTLGARGLPRSAAGAAGSPDRPFADESGPVPTGSAAPLVVGAGLALIALAGAFGSWFLVAGLIPLVLGAVEWLRAAGTELRLQSMADGADPETGPSEHDRGHIG